MMKLESGRPVFSALEVLLGVLIVILSLFLFWEQRQNAGLRQELEKLIEAIESSTESSL